MRDLPGRERTTWAVLVATAAPLVFVAYDGLRLVLGPVPDFLSQGEQAVDRYTRLAYFQQVAAPDRVLLLPLIGLAALAWLLRTGATPARVRPAGLALAALLALESLVTVGIAAYLLRAEEPADGTTFYAGSKPEALVPPLLGGVLLLVLAVVLASALLPDPVTVTVQEDEGPGQLLDEPPAAEGESPEPPLPPVRDEGPPAYEAFRRPGWATEVGPEPAPDADPHAAYRRPSG